MKRKTKQTFDRIALYVLLSLSGLFVLSTILAFGFKFTSPIVSLISAISGITSLVLIGVVCLIIILMKGV